MMVLAVLTACNVAWWFRTIHLGRRKLHEPRAVLLIERSLAGEHMKRLAERSANGDRPHPALAELYRQKSFHALPYDQRRMAVAHTLKGSR